jgi:hypothetical protein
MTRIHHSFLMYDRLRKTSFSKYSVNLYSIMRPQFSQNGIHHFEANGRELPIELFCGA